MADGEGFEPPRRFRARWFSRPVHSTTLPPIRNKLSAGTSKAFWFRQALILCKGRVEAFGIIWSNLNRIQFKFFAERSQKSNQFV